MSVRNIPPALPCAAAGVFSAAPSWSRRRSDRTRRSRGANASRAKTTCCTCRAPRRSSRCRSGTTSSPPTWSSFARSSTSAASSRTRRTTAGSTSTSTPSSRSIPIGAPPTLGRRRDDVRHHHQRERHALPAISWRWAFSAFPVDWELSFMVGCNYLFELKTEDPRSGRSGGGVARNTSATLARRRRATVGAVARRDHDERRGARRRQCATLEEVFLTTQTRGPAKTGEGVWSPCTLTRLQEGRARAQGVRVGVATSLPT